MNRPSRDSSGGRAYLDLRAKARREGRPTDELLVLGAGSHRSSSASLRIDINVGDPVTPEPVEVSYPSVLDEPFELIGYPLETVLAEKIVTMVGRGDATTRDRAFADVFVLTGRHSVDAEQLAAAVRATGAHRGSDLRPLRSVLVDLATARQADWTRYLARSGFDDSAPASLAEAIRAPPTSRIPSSRAASPAGGGTRLHDGGVATTTADW